jgi:hypothetical protein
MPKLPMTARVPLAALLLLTASSMALSQSPGQTPAPTATVPGQAVITEDSINDFAELNQNLATLQEKLAKVKSLEKISNDPSVPESQRAAFRAAVTSLLVSFSDGGEVQQLGQWAVAYVHDKLAEVQQDTHFTPTMKDGLISSWRRLAVQTDAAITSLETTRKDLADKLKLLQQKEDFVNQMSELRQARKMLDAIGDVADQRQAVSERIRDLLAGKATPPDM